jgi:hypothetical protein
VAARQNDDVWPFVAQWLCDQDDAWHTAHRLWLLNGNQRRFAEDQCEIALTIRPTLRQAAWLLALFDKVTAQLERPNPPPSDAIAPRMRRQTTRRRPRMGSGFAAATAQSATPSGHEPEDQVE